MFEKGILLSRLVQGSHGMIIQVHSTFMYMHIKVEPTTPVFIYIYMHIHYTMYMGGILYIRTSIYIIIVVFCPHILIMEHSFKKTYTHVRT